LRGFLKTLGWDGALLALAVILRIVSCLGYDPSTGYDAESHWKTLMWWSHKASIPDVMWARTAYHPPLYYALTGLLHAFKADSRDIQALSVFAGSLRLVVCFLAMREFLPSLPRARAVGMALLAVLPASVHLDGMVNCEGLLGLFSALFLLWGARVFGPRKYAPLVAGLALGAAILTKVSAIALVMAFVGAAIIARPPWRRVLVVLGLVALLDGWYFARNTSHYGKPFLNGYDGPDKGAAAGVEATPYWKRRSLAYVFGWSGAIYEKTSWPSGYDPPRFFPLLVVTTFADYYHYGFERNLTRNPHYRATPSSPESLRLARLSVAAGTLIAAITAAAWMVLAWMALRARRGDWLFLVAAPFVAVLGQLHFAWAFPIDWEGPVKGVYLQFAVPPLAAAFGIGVDWALRRWSTAIIGAAGIAALVAVAAYTLYCRLTACVDILPKV
jgi:4-amino-4-deoxy-L-arabinose transferase-like glycosyltransferase